MRITVITGTEIRGCTYHIKEGFLAPLRGGNEVTEFYLPRDLPHFCRGCKTCFFKSELRCPHADYVAPIWNAMLEADLLVFASPVYALRTTAQMKALLDHLCVHWMVHRPDDKMFHKKAVILTNAIGVFNGGAQRDIETSLLWMGVPDIRKLGVGLLEGVIWSELSEKRRGIILGKAKNLAAKYRNDRPARKGIRTGVLFFLLKTMHRHFSRKQETLSADDQHWVDKGWI